MAANCRTPHFSWFDHDHHRFNGEKVIRNMVFLQDSVKNFRFESATLEAELMKLSRYSRILNECEERGLGLVPPTEPPKKIKVKR